MSQEKLKKNIYLEKVEIAGKNIKCKEVDRTLISD